ncbi:hypothetical protein PIB30_103306 [Stylosanthes scabra]|uniref:RRM domain-containing protein n=1 Tax=Stylosanthes scabra TaxID=79078 RepID=A0ABU6QY20_9FABA|nr:hypothetical protein [Stylosanthes scabra]
METYTIFVDNLPTGVTKRALFKEFGKDGYIPDIFISTKIHSNATGPFAFIRFNSYGGTMKSIKRMNGTNWGDTNLYVALSKFGRNGVHGRAMFNTENPNKKRQRVVRKLVKVKKIDQGSDIKSEALNVDQLIIPDQRKLLEEWKGLGEIKCRDVGPYKCLLTFSSSEIRDEALQNQLLLTVFDEVRPHWDIF